MYQNNWKYTNKKFLRKNIFSSVLSHFSCFETLNPLKLKLDFIINREFSVLNARKNGKIEPPCKLVQFQGYPRFT